MFKKLKSKGFTLIELMITVAIAAIILTIGIPSFRAMVEKNRLKGAAEILYGDLQYARSESIKQNTNIEVHFGGTTSDWCYGLDDDLSTVCDCTATPASNCTVQGVIKVVKSDDYPEINLTQNFGANDTGFDSTRGISLDNGTATFQVSGGGDSVNIVLSNLGRVRICSDDIWDYEDCGP